MILKDLEHPVPKWLQNNTMFLTYMGSHAYGVARPDSDFDVYGWCIPPKNFLFPHLDGHIEGFGERPNKFDQWIAHHITHKEKEYDFNVFNIVKYFQLCLDGNPNMIDSMFTPLNCILHSCAISNMVRENRQLFLSKKLFHTFKGYCYSQMHKIKQRNPQEGSKRHADVEAHGFDTKYAYHVVRLLSEIEQILTEHDLVLDEKSRREHMKAVRNGEVDVEEILKWAKAKEMELDLLCTNSTLRDKKATGQVKQLLVECLEHHYGSLAKAVVTKSDAEVKLEKIVAILGE
jgi:predicted nucleotidyltransferase